MLPLSLLNAAIGQPMLVELKSGETLNGHLVSCDTWMNLVLKEVIVTSPDGASFTKVPEYYVRGSLIKYLRVPDELIDQIKEQNQQQRNERNYNNNNNNNNNRNYNNSNYRGRGGRGGRGGSRGGFRQNYNPSHNTNNPNTGSPGNIRNYNNQNQRY